MWTKRGPRLARRQGGPILPRSRKPPALRSSATCTDFGPDRLAGHDKADHGLDRAITCLQS
jgi:hypothetical protein